MIKPSLTPEEVVEFLNEVLELDPRTISRLMNKRFRCRKLLADHPTVQVNRQQRVGVLGLLNGMFGTFDDGPHQGWGPITMGDHQTKPGLIGKFFLTKDL